jgi:hypothetical protein
MKIKQLIKTRQLIEQWQEHTENELIRDWNINQFREEIDKELLSTMDVIGFDELSTLESTFDTCIHEIVRFMNDIEMKEEAEKFRVQAEKARDYIQEVTSLDLYWK